MVINGRKTLNQLVKDYSHVILVIIITIFLLFYAAMNTLVQYLNEQDRIATVKLLESEKIESIKKVKAGLICNKQYLAPNDYDVISINGNILIETVTSIGKPSESIEFNKCEIYDKITSSIVIPAPLTMEEKVVTEMNGLKSKVELLQTDNINHKVKVDNLEKIVSDKNAEIKKLITLVEDKQKSINELTEYSVKYKEVKELLTVALSGQNNKLTEIMSRLLNTPIKPENDFIVKAEETKILDNARKVAEKNSVVDLQLSGSTNNDIERQLQLRAYIIKELSGKLSKRVDIEKFDIPTVDILKLNKITEAQLKNAENTMSSYNKTIEKMIDILGKITYVDKDLLKKNMNILLQSEFK